MKPATSSVTRYAIRTESHGDVCFVKAEVGLDLRLRVSLSVTPEDAAFGSREHAERWAQKVSKHDPSLRLDVVEV